MAEFRKLTASLLTPTIKSPTAKRPSRITINKYESSISLVKRRWYNLMKMSFQNLYMKKVEFENRKIHI